MTTFTVWLLVVMTHVYGGANISPITFPTEKDCEQVRKNMEQITTWSRCIQTTVVKP